MRFLIPFLTLILAGCSGSMRARTPAEWVGFGAASSFESTLSEGLKTDDCTALQLQRLRNEFLKKELEACKENPPKPDPVEPDVIDVPIELRVVPIELEVVPVDREGALPVGTFPPAGASVAVASAAAIRAACCAPR